MLFILLEWLFDESVRLYIYRTYPNPTPARIPGKSNAFVIFEAEYLPSDDSHAIPIAAIYLNSRSINLFISSHRTFMHLTMNLPVRRGDMPASFATCSADLGVLLLPTRISTNLVFCAILATRYQLKVQDEKY